MCKSFDLILTLGFKDLKFNKFIFCRSGVTSQNKVAMYFRLLPGIVISLACDIFIIMMYINLRSLQGISLSIEPLVHYVVFIKFQLTIFFIFIGDLKFND